MQPGEAGEHAIALAGVFQAARLVHGIARQGLVDDEAFEASIASVFRIDADTAESVFGARGRLRLGLETLCTQLGRTPGRQDPELTRYAASLMFLERKLARRPAMLDRIRADIESAGAQVAMQSCTHESVVARLAGIYIETVSTLGPRIMVHGEPRFLAVDSNAERIRALLLAGMRATVLWRQVGGNRLRLFLARGRVVERAQDMLAELEA